MAFLKIHFEWVWVKFVKFLFLFQNKHSAAFFYSRQSRCEIDLVKSAFDHKKPLAKVVWDAMAFQNLDYDCIWVKNSRALTIFWKSDTHQFYNKRRSPFLSDLVKMAFGHKKTFSKSSGPCHGISEYPFWMSLSENCNSLVPFSKQTDSCILLQQTVTLRDWPSQIGLCPQKACSKSCLGCHGVSESCLWLHLSKK